MGRNTQSNTIPNCITQPTALLFCAVFSSSDDSCLRWNWTGKSQHWAFYRQTSRSKKKSCQPGPPSCSFMLSPGGYTPGQAFLTAIPRGLPRACGHKGSESSMELLLVSPLVSWLAPIPALRCHQHCSPLTTPSHSLQDTLSPQGSKPAHQSPQENGCCAWGT